MERVKESPPVHQLALKAAALVSLLNLGLLLLTGQVAPSVFGGAPHIWIYLLATIPLVYWWVRLILSRLLRDGRLILMDDADKNTQLTRQMARLQLTTHAILEASSQGIFGLDPNGAVTFMNPAMCEMLGYREDELVGRSHHEMVHHHHADGSPYPREDCPIYRAIETGTTARGEEVYIRKDGSSLPVEFVCSPMWENAAMIGAVVFFLDIRERRRAETQLHLASRVYENILEGLVVTDAEHRIISVNPAFSRITGYTQDEVIGRHPKLLKSGHHTAEFYQAMWRDIDAHGQWSGEVINQHKNGEIYPQWLNISRVCDGDGNVTHYIGAFTDMTALKASRDQLIHLAYHDALTNLPNRLLFNDRLRQAIKRAKREDCQVAILFIDLDRFKHINDTLGHSVGDEMLRQVAERLTKSLRAGDTVARLGGDEFVVLLDRLDEVGDAARVARKLKSVFEAPYRIDGRELFAGASIGISLFPDDGTDADTLLRNADASMYQAKEIGGNNYQFYTEELTSASAQRLKLESDLRYALDRGELELFYQPQIALRDSAVVGAETLLYWRHPELGLLSSQKFIPIAEETGLILPIGDWVLRTACRQARAWLDLSPSFNGISVNISGRQVREGRLMDAVSQALGDSGLPAENLELEVTESFIMVKVEYSIGVLLQLKNLGVSLSIDNFGTGYSSLSYLQRLPIDRLKIDQSFLVDVPEDADNTAIVGAVIALGHSLQLPVVAAGIGTPQQHDFLVSSGCELAQGHFYSKPLSKQDFVPWLTSSNKASTT